MPCKDVSNDAIARLADSVVAKLKLTGDKFEIDDCDVCGYPRGFEAVKEVWIEPSLIYDSGCDCTPGRPYQYEVVHIIEIRKYLSQAVYFNRALKFLNRPVTDFLD